MWWMVIDEGRHIRIGKESTGYRNPQRNGSGERAGGIRRDQAGDSACQHETMGTARIALL